MRTLMTVSTLICCLTVNVTFAQEGSDKKEDKKTAGALETRVEMMSTIMLQMFKKAELSDEQKQKVEGVINKYVPQLVKSRDETDKLLDKDQMRLFNKARNIAKKAGYDDDQADNYALKKLKLEESKATNFKKMKNMVVDLNNSMNREIASLLTEEQKGKLPLFGGKPSKKTPKGNLGKEDKTKGSAAKEDAK